VRIPQVLEAMKRNKREHPKKHFRKEGTNTMRSANPFGVCRNCGKQIMWIRTKAGKNMPVDPIMISYRRPDAGKKATERVVTFAGDVLAADRVDSSQAEGTGYISHFATCTKRRG